MNQLDELLAETAGVDDLAPKAWRSGRAALQAAIASRSAAQSAATQSAAAEPPHRRARRPRRSKRGVVIAASVAAAAAVAAGTLVAVIPGHAGGSRPQPAGGSVTSSANVNLTAAVVLRAAAKAAGQQQGGWPDATYWHVSTVYEADGKIHHREIWVAHHGTSVLEDNGVFGTMTPQNLGYFGFSVGNTHLSWNQLYALPTDPARLEAVLTSDLKGTYPPGASSLWSAVGELLRETPASPALREALYEVVAGIPGAKLLGQQKDALGRTGTAVKRGDETFIIDPDNGQLLADNAGNPTKGIPCGQHCMEFGEAATFTSEGPAASAPALPGQRGTR